MPCIMHRYFIALVLFFVACTLPEKKKANQLSKKTDTTVIESIDANAAALDTANAISLPAVKKIRYPNGIYRTYLPPDNQIEQTIAFNSDFTYQLQEKYSGDKKDSIVISQGIWTPSDGFIWLYKDQLARGRYKWKGDELQYYSPLAKKNFSMQRLTDILQNLAWRNKAKMGILVFGIGNEPFWNIELDGKDSVSFLLPEWDHPLRMKIDSSFNNSDSTGYLAKTDSVQMRVTIFPHFCSDGMSDFTYRNKIRVQYNHQVYNGCGMVYKL